MHQVIEFYEQNLRLARETNDRRGELSALGSLGRAYEALNEMDKARDYFDLCLQVAREIGDVRQERSLLKHLDADSDKKVRKTNSGKSRKKTATTGDSSQPKKTRPRTRKTP
ncbi:MAG TPA: tetratricopeptide repeat protein [Blastocatellia bacterium]|nr:tetratricopeptide repeat protein [Blastocatellia bacterium]HMX29344.1 tetratricopeptide repeat protein [Blastocatellia bacterium]HMZ21995.1 tetratricopeptide repeat protein [Blastocatellia bacterium]HNG34692.1 tetratricopeptide repeat protein [Blastocatellia bacterium]